MRRANGLSVMGVWLGVGLLAMGEPALARDAAFADPGMGTKGTGDAIVVEPKNEIDTGESVVNVGRRTTLFFVNKTNSPVDVNSTTTNDDGNVKSSIISNDCSREGKIQASSRCMVVVETTPSNAGNWTAEVILTHSGPGRIARAKLTGKAGGMSSAEKKEAGFTLSSKEVKPIDFSKVQIDGPKVVRTALMVNDSPENIVLVSIDVIAAENGLERLDQGCVIDMELKPGESCPVTLIWKPVSKGIISTDLIIRHTGRLGFAVIPIRGVADDDSTEVASETKDNKGSATNNEASRTTGKMIPKKPTTAEELDKAMANQIPPLTTDMLTPGVATTTTTTVTPQTIPGGEFRLIGTVGHRAVLLKPDGTTSVVGLNEEIAYGDGKTAKITNVTPKTAEIFMDGKKKQLVLGAAQELTSKAAAAHTAETGVSFDGSSTSSSSSGTRSTVGVSK